MVKTLAKAEVRVPAGQATTKTVEAAWPDAKFWWPEDPHLYVLQTDLKPTSGASDRHVQRFGFREMWIEGISFYLNGVRTKIRSQWASGACGIFRAAEFWQPDQRLEGIWSWQTHCVQNGDTQLTRASLGYISGDEVFDIADETGLMIKCEAPVNQVNFTFDQTFWKAALQQELHTIDVYKNHPAITMWSAGNENMWGWIYQGEAAKVMGNRWQVKIVKAMNDFDLMHRPIEWEADGDLMGGWNYHALHYPRELNQFPDIPNGAWWEPDGKSVPDRKTVVPYSMGPIKLGEKPITVGEAFWPATLSHPYGETLLLGDEAYLGGNYWFKGWLDSSQYFINGFRDIEFSLIDIYCPLRMIKPQTIVLKQEVNTFFGGRRVKLEVNVHNDVRRSADMTLRWSLLSGRGEARGGGASQVPRPASLYREVKLRLGPAELKRLTLDISLPPVNQRTGMTLRLALLESGKVVHEETRHWTLYPPPSVQVPSGLKVAVYDPLGQTAAMLKRLSIPFARMSQLKPPEAKALIIGRDALKQTPEGPWREELAGFVRDGGKVVILQQSESPDFLPVPLTMVGHRKATIAFRRSEDHPLLKGLDDAQLRWWAAGPEHPSDNHYVSAGNYRKPLRGNYLPLIDAGSMDGMVETPLLEEYEGKGSYLLCQLLLTEKATLAPQACALVQNLLNYLTTSRSYRTPGATAVIAKEDSPLRKALDDNRVVYEDVTGKASRLKTDRFRVAILEGASVLDASVAAAVKDFAGAGGHVMLHRVAPEQQRALESLLGVRLRFFPVVKEPQDIQYHAFRRSNDDLMAGISNHELFWASSGAFANLRHEGVWWSQYACPPEEMIADYFVAPGDDQADKAASLTRPGTLLQVPVGSGYILLNQLRLDQAVADCAITATRLRSLLFTNLGCTLRGEGGAAQARARRLKQYEFFTVDLSPYANRGLADNKAAGIVGWTNQGENDMRALPVGNQTFAGIPFRVAAPKAAIVLHSRSANNIELPREVTGIKIGRRADVLFFLHTAAWTSEKPFKYRVNYEDGTTLEIPIINEQQVLDWWSDPNRYAEAMARHGLFVAWQGDNPMHKGVILPGYEWVNPNPDKLIRDVDFLTVPEGEFYAVPVLVAITGAVNKSTEGVVADVIGTQGVRVKLGTQEQEVYYIGVAGIAKDHPFYEKAVAAHRALVVGQKVTLQYDVVTQDTDGHTVAYVYLGKDIYDVRSLVNAKIIGEGLGKLGNFAGNNRQRMYLDNLGFIAQQGKKGMWGEGLRQGD